jgi:hypothetical protein
VSDLPTKVLPPGPFPPTGMEPPGVVDLGIRLRDALYRRAVVLDARSALHSNIRAASRSPQQILMALPAIDAFIDTWPLASMIDEAMARWRTSPDPASLAVMHRAAEVVGSVLGWPRSIDRRWPLPDEAWMRKQVPGRCRVVSRGPRDGAPAAAVALDAMLGRAEPVPLPGRASTHGDELVARVPDLLAGLRNGVVSAVDVDGWIPWDTASQAAWTALRDATPLQQAYARYGLAALVAGGGPPFAELLGRAPPSPVRDRMVRTCDALVVPGLDPDGAMQPVGVLCWNAAYRPVRVNPAAIRVLELFDAPRAVADAPRVLQSDASAVLQVIDQLAGLGALATP